MVFFCTYYLIYQFLLLPELSTAYMDFIIGKILSLLMNFLTRIFLRSSLFSQNHLFSGKILQPPKMRISINAGISLILFFGSGYLMRKAYFLVSSVENLESSSLKNITKHYNGLVLNFTT